MQAYNICLYYKKYPEKDRFIYGDRYIRPVLRKIIRGKQIGGIDLVFINLCKSLDLLKIKYTVNKPFKKLMPNDLPIVLGIGKFSLNGYDKPNLIIAGIALMTHPSEWPDLCQNYPVVKYLQHSEWAKNVYVKYFGEQICDTWFAGIDTNEWRPKHKTKTIDFLIYKKISWDQDKKEKELINPIKNWLTAHGFTFQVIVYGQYTTSTYRALLDESSAMIFISEHESQGFACCEAMSMDVPIFAWEQGFCYDPNRFKWNDLVIPATSTPFFDEKCGLRFKDFSEFKINFTTFMVSLEKQNFEPRNYIINNLSLRKSGEQMLSIIDSINL